ncbi:MAG: hypothetical protein EOM37_02620 [Proteobacteria bacterium]|nr:hypothetical protein [Pseudomonadota bacterium]
MASALDDKPKATPAEQEKHPWQRFKRKRNHQCKSKADPNRQFDVLGPVHPPQYTHKRKSKKQ